MALFKKGAKEPADPTPVRVDPSFGEPVGRRIRLAARSGDALTLQTLIDGVTDPHAREAVLHAGLTGVPAASWIEHLPEEHPDSPTAWLVRGTHGLHRAWEAVGGEYRRSADVAARDECRERLEQAESDLVQATRLADDDPTAWSLLIVTGYGLGRGFEEVCNRFDEADRRASWHFLAHLHMLQASSAKWGGSDDTMFAFARDVAVNAPDYSPCRAVIAAAHIERWWRGGEPDPATTLGHALQAPDALAELTTATNRSVASSNFVDDGAAVIARNIVAMALLEAGETDRCRAQLVSIRDRVSDYPWIYQDPDPGLAFARARQRVAPNLVDW